MYYRLFHASAIIRYCCMYVIFHCQGMLRSTLSRVRIRTRWASLFFFVYCFIVLWYFSQKQTQHMQYSLGMETSIKNQAKKQYFRKVTAIVGINSPSFSEMDHWFLFMNHVLEEECPKQTNNQILLDFCCIFCTSWPKTSRGIFHDSNWLASFVSFSLWNWSFELHSWREADI